MPHHRRRRSRSRFLSMVGGVAVGALLLFAGGRTPLSSPAIGSWQPQLQQGFFPPPELLRSPPPELLLSESPARQESQADLSFARRLLPVRRRAPPPQLLEDDAVLLPDDEVLVLAADPPVGNAMCVFPAEGASSPARALGRLPGPGRHAYVCVMPSRLLPSPAAAPAAHLQAPPRLLLPSSPHLLDHPLLPSLASPAPASDRTLLSWSDNKLVFLSAPLGGGGDVLVFAKGSRQGINMPPGDVQCLYSGATMVDASFPAITSTQQVTRCPSPPQSLSYCRVTLVLRGQETLPSIATYVPYHSALSVTHDKQLICACTMVRNVAKFISEWVRYHAGIGIEHFYLYDNGSQDDLAHQVAKLNAAGFKVSTVAWPWTKTQEAGFSHCAAAYRSSCHWMAFVDVDDFIFSPKWHSFDSPSKSMLQEVVSVVDPQVGQIYFNCYDFGPSGQTAHPSEGVCQGYICRMEKPLRHKSLVRLDAVDDSLENHIHHFKLKSGFHFEWTRLARVNHYKFQAWPEFEKKFERRVSAYVTDWKDPANLQSGDRAPGLGVEAIEPDGGWAGRYCERNDTVMKDTSIKWFGVGLGGTGDISLSPSPPSLFDKSICFPVLLLFFVLVFLLFV